MAKALLIAFSSAVPGKDAEYETWYEECHIPDLRAAIPSITGVSRYREVDLTGGSERVRYVAVYELSDADVAAAAGQLAAAGRAGRVRRTDTIDMTDNPPDLHWVVATGAGADA